MRGPRIGISAPATTGIRCVALLQLLRGFSFGDLDYFYPEGSVKGNSKTLKLDDGGVIEAKPTSGLRNTSKSCYKNAVLQLLAHLPPIANTAKERVDGSEETINAKDYEQVFYSEILKMLRPGEHPGQARYHFEYALAPELREDVLTAMPDDKGQCPSAYLDSVLTKLSGQEGPPKMETEINRIFGFFTHSERNCVKCSQSLDTPAEFQRTLYLSFPSGKPKTKSKLKRFGKALLGAAGYAVGFSTSKDPPKRTFDQLMHYNFFPESEIHDFDCPDCGPSTLTEALSLAVPPNVFLTVLGRAGKKGPIRDQVEIPNQLSLSPYILQGSGYDQIDNDYVLQGLITFSQAATLVHFITYCRQGDQWFEYNDSRVRRVSDQEIPKLKKVYIAAYCRKQPVPAPDASSPFHPVILSPNQSTEVQVTSPAGEEMSSPVPSFHQRT